mmetsp:Transcript_45712/g.95792  ORF Transcript_45712/g.95792 Transcript_45712/m.95792 type:complete len:789 (-) Transcript_45712:124-2490(-)
MIVNTFLTCLKHNINVVQGFKIMCDFIIFRLFIGVTLEAFASCTSREQSSIKEEDILLFSKFWVENLDPLATGFIPLKMVPPMIRSLGSPFDILSLRLRTMRYLCIRKELIILSENSGKFVPKGLKGPLVLLLRKLQAIEDNLWRPILEEHSVEGKDAAFSASMDQDEESSQGDYEVPDEDTSEGHVSPGEIEDTRQGIASISTRQGARLDCQDEMHPFQISGNNFGRRQSTSANRRFSKIRKISSSKRVRKKSFIPLSAAAAKENSIIAKDQSQSENASRPGTPQATWKILLVQIPIWCLLKLLPRHEFLKRRPEYVRFDEVLHALIYWNPSFRWVPRSVVVSRSVLDQEIVTAVAKDMIGALCSGVAVRYRLSKLLLLGESNLYHDQDHESALLETGTNNEEAQTIDENHEFPASWIDAANFWEKEEEESTSRGALARILIQNSVTLSDLISIGSDQGLQIELLPNIFEDEQIPDILCSDPRLAPACDQVRAKEIIRRLLKAGNEKLLKLYAEGLGFDVYSVTDLSELSIQELTSLLKLKPVQAKVLEVDGPPWVDENVDIDDAIAESNDKMVELNKKLDKIKEERAQLLAVVAEAKTRQIAAQTETDCLASALRLQGINLETKDVPDPLVATLLPGDVTDDGLLGSSNDLDSASASMLESASVNDSNIAQTSTEIPSSGAVDLAKLRDEIAVKRAQLKRLQEQLKVSKIREAASSTVTDLTEAEEAEILACRQVRLQRRMERRQQVSDLSASKSGLSAMGIEGPKKTRYNKGNAEETAGKLPAWL